MEDEALHEAPIWSDVVTFDGKPWRGTVDCITGGYPCQPFSSAGKKLGKEDERWLWSSIRRIVNEVQPEWCFFENVPNHLRVGFEQVDDDLRGMGYRVAAGLFEAAEVGAGHQRKRLFILAHSVSKRRERSHEGISPNLDGSKGKEKGVKPQPRRPAHAADDGGAVMDGGSGLSAGWPPLGLGFPPRPDSGIWRNFREPAFLPATPLEPTVLGVADGAATRMDRLRASGNAAVPLVAGYAFCILAEALRSA